jgi:predicted DNA-binding transcriptional regulator AlpA
MSEAMKATLNEREFCEAVGISRVTAWRERKAGRLPFCRIAGNKVAYLPRHVDEFLRACERNRLEETEKQRA